MQVLINGEPKVLGADITVSDLVQHLGLRQRRIAVEINRQIIDRETYATRTLCDGDEIEIVQFVGGG